jgi:hypothetical protein
MKIRTKQAVCTLATLSTIWLTLAANADDGFDRVTTIPVPNGGRPVAARADDEGTIHLLYDAPDGPQYVNSTNYGESFGTPIPVIDRRSRKPGLEFQGEDMAVGKGGVVHVALSTNAWKLKLPQREWALHYARLEPGATAFSPVRNLNSTPSEGYSLAADDKGNVTACWLSGKLYANISHDNGKTFAPRVEIDPSFDPCDCCTTSAVYGPDGKLAVLYREEANNERDMYLVTWDQERNQVSRARISATLWKIDTCPMSSYSICRHRDGFIAVWPTNERIYFARLANNGEDLQSQEIKTDGKAGMRTGMLALGGRDGSTLVAWKNGDDLNWQIYDSHGQPSGSPGSASSSGSRAAGVVVKEGRFILFR